MKAIRDNVRENALSPGTVIDRDDYVRGITVEGKAWVAVDGDEVVGFACGRIVQRDIWALFVRADHERLGIARALMDRVEAWMFEHVDRIVLTTAPGTRAERFYRARGWTCDGVAANGRELAFSLTRRAS
jgi:GNAT superfamily N-acetyltransferase